MAQTINLTDSRFVSTSDEAEVMDFYKHINVLQQRLEQRSTELSAGQIRHCLSQWEEMTDDKEILNMVKGVDVDFCETEIPSQESVVQMHFSQEQTKAVDTELQVLLSKGVVVPCSHSSDEYVPPIFIVPKKDNKFRMILNLKNLNQFVEQHHFKTETLKYALTLVSHNCFFCSLDLHDAYFSVYMAPAAQNFLKFVWKGQLYKFSPKTSNLWPVYTSWGSY